MYQALLALFLLVSVLLVALIMLQQGKNADIGASFSIATPGSIFRSHGSDHFMTRITAVFATIFFILSLVLGNLSSTHKTSPWNNLDENKHQHAETVEAEASEKMGNDIPE